MQQRGWRCAVVFAWLCLCRASLWRRAAWNVCMMCSASPHKALSSKTLYPQKQTQSDIHFYDPLKKLLRHSPQPDLFHARNQTHKYTMEAAIQTAQQGDIHTCTAAFEKVCKLAPPSVRDCNRLLKALGDRGELHICAQVLETMESLKLRPTVVTYSTLISCAGAWRRPDLAEMYFDRMGVADILPDVQAFNTLVNAYVKGGDVTQAFEVLLKMEQQGVKPNEITYNTLIDGCVRLGKIDQALRVFADMKRRGLQPNFRTYSALIHAYGKEGNLQRAFALLGIMKNKGLRPSAITYSSLLHACGKAGQLDKAFDVMRMMRDQGMRPTVVTWTSLIHACGKAGEIDLAFALFREMISTGARANSITCSTLIDTCLKAGEVDKAFHVLNFMRDFDLQPNEVTYTSMLTELTRLGQVDRIVQLLEDMERYSEIEENKKSSLPSNDNLGLGLGSELGLERRSRYEGSEKQLRKGVRIPPEVGAQVVQLLSKSDTLDRAFKVLETMIFERQFPPESAVQTVMQAVDTARQLDRAAEVLASYRNMSSQTINEMTYTALLGACGRANHLMRAFAVFQEMRDSGLAPSETNYHALLEVCRNAKDCQAAIDVFESMKSSGVKPSTLSYKTLMNTIFEDTRRRAERVVSYDSYTPKDVHEVNPKQVLHRDNLFRLFLVHSEMRASRVPSDTAVYNTLINACAKAADLSRALDTVAQMQEEAVPLDVITYTCIIKACGAVGDVDLAEDVFRAMQQRTNHFSTYVAPTELTYAALMSAYLRGDRDTNSSTSRVVELYEELLGRGIVPDVMTYRNMVHVHRNRLEVEGVLEFVERIRSQTSRRFDAKSWAMATEVCRRTGRMHEFEELKREMKEHET